MDANERLRAAQSALTERGARDVKFFFAPEAGCKLPSEVKEDLVTVLEACINGRVVDQQSFADELPRR